jgi:hypothetical protein
MKFILLISVLFPFAARSQSNYDRSQDTKLNKAISDISALKTTITVLKTKMKADSTTLEKRIKILSDSVTYYKGWLSSDLKIDKNKIITIPKLLLIEARLTKLEANR